MHACTTVLVGINHCNGRLSAIRRRPLSGGYPLHSRPPPCFSRQRWRTPSLTGRLVDRGTGCVRHCLHVWVNPRPAGVFSRTRPAGGGGIFCPPCLTPELIGAARRARRRSKALNEKIPMHFKNFLKGVTCKVKVRSKVRNMCFRIIAHRDRAINSRAPKLSQNASLQQESSPEEYCA